MVSRGPPHAPFAHPGSTTIRRLPAILLLLCTIGLIGRPFVVPPPSGPTGPWVMEIQVKALLTDRDNSIQISLSAKRPRSAAFGKTHNWFFVQSSTMPSITPNSPIPARTLGPQISALLHKPQWRPV